MERIVNSSHIIHLSLRLLSLLKFDNLTCLELYCIYDANKGTTLISQRQERTQALIQDIYNAPSLEKLVLTYENSRFQMLVIYIWEQQN